MLGPRGARLHLQPQLPRRPDPYKVICGCGAVCLGHQHLQVLPHLPGQWFSTRSDGSCAVLIQLVSVFSCLIELMPGNRCCDLTQDGSGTSPWPCAAFRSKLQCFRHGPLCPRAAGGGSQACCPGGGQQAAGRCQQKTIWHSSQGQGAAGPRRSSGGELDARHGRQEQRCCTGGQTLGRRGPRQVAALPNGTLWSASRPVAFRPHATKNATCVHPHPSSCRRSAQPTRQRWHSA